MAKFQPNPTQLDFTKKLTEFSAQNWLIFAKFGEIWLLQAIRPISPFMGFGRISAKIDGIGILHLV
jgi:hypothetical protein